MDKIEQIQFLRAAVAELFGETDVITQSIDTRIKKHKIAEEYRRRREAGEEKKDLIYDLARKYHYSEKTIRLVVYTF